MSNDVSKIIFEMELYARKNQVPIIKRDSLVKILSILEKKEAPKILEIGTAIGYSTLSFVHNLPGSSVITIERNTKMFEIARHFFQDLSDDISKKITIYEGDALEISPYISTLSHRFDAIFIDGAKGQYRRFFELYAPFLKDDGVILTDNVFFRGLVDDTAEIKNNRLYKIADKIKMYNEWLKNHPNYATEFFSCGDGLAITRKIT